MMAYDKICDAIPQKHCNEDEAMENEARQKKTKANNMWNDEHFINTEKKRKKIT